LRQPGELVPFGVSGFKTGIKAKTERNQPSPRTKVLGYFLFPTTGEEEDRVSSALLNLYWFG
jgi:hypothetical protein